MFKSNKIRNKQNENLKIIFSIKVYILCLLLCGCAGDQNKINKDINKENSENKSNRDRTPNTPRINIPANTF
jgi:hypothetical protein